MTGQPTILPSRELTGPLLRAARALASIKAEELSAESKVSLATIKRAETSVGLTRMTEANAERLIEVLRTRGVVFLRHSEYGDGVHKRTSPD